VNKSTTSDPGPALPEETKQALPLKYCGSLYPRKTALPRKLVNFVQGVEKHYGARVVMILQDDEDDSELDAISDELYEGVAGLELSGEPVIVLIHSLGGLADSAYQIVLALKEKCGSFKSFVPVRAKSAATLIAMGGTSIIMPPLAHLGPIDAQVFDYDIGGRFQELSLRPGLRNGTALQSARLAVAQLGSRPNLQLRERRE
jgi:hypothetical protein